MPLTQTKTLTEALDRLDGVDKDDAWAICERYQIAMQAGGFEDDQELQDVVADMRGYGITPEMLSAAVAETPAPTPPDPEPPEGEPEDEPEEGEAEGAEPEPEIEDSGQTALVTGDPIVLTNVVRGPRPERAELNVGSFTLPANEDHHPGETLLLQVMIELGPVTVGGEVRKHAAKVMRTQLLDTGGLTASEAFESENAAHA
jgi:hypothetical protein